MLAPSTQPLPKTRRYPPKHRVIPSRYLPSTIHNTIAASTATSYHPLQDYVTFLLDNCDCKSDNKPPQSSPHQTPRIPTVAINHYNIPSINRPLPEDNRQNEMLDDDDPPVPSIENSVFDDDDQHHDNHNPIFEQQHQHNTMGN